MLSHIILRTVPYCGAAATVTAALVARMLLHPLLGENRPFLTFLPAVALCAWIGGRRPAIFAIVLSYGVANWFLMPPVGSFDFNHASASDWANVLTFVVLSVIIIEPIVALQRAERRAEAAAAHVLQLLAAAKEADLQKDRFLATLSHELRNPLASLTAGLTLWSLGRCDLAEMEELRALMSRQVKQISRLVDDLLDVARVSRGRIRLQKERVEIAMLIGHALQSIRPAMEERGHQLHLDLADEPIVVDGDVVRLTQVFVNILDNAAKYTGRDGSIWVDAHRQGDEVVVRIRDNGPGISEVMLATVFQMFSQASSTADHSGGGLGIGLFLVKQLVELHGGQVEALSEGAGKGAEFVVTLPLGADELVAAAGPSTSLPTQQMPVIPHHKIVVADDVQEAASMLAEMLRLLGQDVTVATDGAAALESVIAQRAEIVFLDIAMPGMNGYEVAERLRAQPETESVVLVALTGYGRPEDRQRAFAAGFDNHLTKPTNVEDLEKLLVTI